jgi:rubrerythrin
VQTTLLQLQARHEDWGGARATLAKALKAGNVPRDLHKRRDAVLALAHARDAMAEGKIAEATRDATEANRLVPSLVPAAAMAARLAIAEKKPRVATKILKAAWATDPHPDLAAAFAEIAPGETPNERLKRFQPLIAKHPGNPESKLLEAELQIAREDFPAARRALGDLAETRPTARSLTIMAAIERGEGSEDRIVQAWLARAVTASRGPQWICGKCGHVHAEWRPVCANCESFDTLAWEEAPQSDAALAGPAQMLPLIVGSLEDKSARDDVEDADTVDGRRRQPDFAADGPNRPRRGRALGRRKGPFPGCRSRARRLNEPPVPHQRVAGEEFRSDPGRRAAVAQLVEHVIRNDGVGGSSPFSGTTLRAIRARHQLFHGQRTVPENRKPERRGNTRGLVRMLLNGVAVIVGDKFLIALRRGGEDALDGQAACRHTFEKAVAQRLQSLLETVARHRHRHATRLRPSSRRRRHAPSPPRWPRR